MAEATGIVYACLCGICGRCPGPAMRLGGLCGMCFFLSNRETNTFARQRRNDLIINEAIAGD